MFVVTEAAGYWIADCKWKWDQYMGGGHTTKKMAALLEGKISKLPSEYFGTNLFVGASTMSKEEIRRRHVLGLDAVMWGTDYPHPEGSWPNTAAKLKTDFCEVPVEETKQLLGAHGGQGLRLRPRGPATDRRPDRLHPAGPGPGPGVWQPTPTPPPRPSGGWPSTGSRRRADDGQPSIDVPTGVAGVSPAADRSSSSDAAMAAAMASRSGTVSAQAMRPQLRTPQ